MTTNEAIEKLVELIRLCEEEKIVIVLTLEHARALLRACAGVEYDDARMVSLRTT